MHRDAVAMQIETPDFYGNKCDSATEETSNALRQRRDADSPCLVKIDCVIVGKEGYNAPRQRRGADNSNQACITTASKDMLIWATETSVNRNRWYDVLSRVVTRLRLSIRLQQGSVP